MNHRNMNSKTLVTFLAEALWDFISFSGSASGKAIRSFFLEDQGLLGNLTKALNESGTCAVGPRELLFLQEIIELLRIEF